EASRPRQDRDEAVELAVQAHLADDIDAVGLHAAVVVVQLDASQLAHHPVEDPTGEHLVPRVAADALPAADDIQFAAIRPAAFEGGEEARYLGWIVLQIGIEGDDGLALDGAEAGGEGRCLAEVAPEADAGHIGVARG